MRQLLAALIAASLALSPVAFLGLGGGIPAAHADLGWCDECASALPVRAPAPAPVLIAPSAPVSVFLFAQP